MSEPKPSKASLRLARKINQVAADFDDILTEQKLALLIDEEFNPVVEAANKYCAAYREWSHSQLLADAIRRDESKRELEQALSKLEQ